MPHKRLVRQVLSAKPTGKRPKCRPRTRWRDFITDPAWSRLGVDPQKYLKLLLIVRFSKSAYGCCPRRNRTFRSGRFGISRFGLGGFGLAVSVWGHFDHDISVHKQLIAFVYLNDYIGR